VNALHTCALASLFLLATAVRAGDREPRLAASDYAGFEAQSAVIRRDLAQGKIYSELDQRQRNEVLAALDRMHAALEAQGNIASMPEDAKLRVFNDQELVNATLTLGREDSSLLCSRETPVGSHRPVISCETVAERRRKRDQSKDTMRALQRAPSSLPTVP
jgi:hypothetical protein